MLGNPQGWEHPAVVIGNATIVMRTSDEEEEECEIGGNDVDAEALDAKDRRARPAEMTSESGSEIELKEAARR